MSPHRTLTADNFERQPRGPYLFNFWHANQRVPTSFGEFIIEAHMPLEDTAPPDPEMVRQASSLAEFVRTHPDAVLDRIYEHYQIVSKQQHWMDICEVPLGLDRNGLTPYLMSLSLVVDRDHSEPTIHVSPQWDDEHAIYLAVRDGDVEFQDL